MSADTDDNTRDNTATNAFFARVWSLCKKALKTMAVVLAIFAMYAGYGVFVEKAARKDAQTFCDGVNVGDSAEGLIARAISSGANSTTAHWVKSDGQPDWLPIVFVGLPPFSRHICSVYAVGGKVTKVNQMHMG